MRNLRRKMDTQTVDLSTFSADLMDTPQTADSSIFKAPADVHCFFLARSRCGPHYRQTHADALSRAQRRAMSAIELCRTAALGGHVEQCDACGHQRIAYDSCRHRCCPKCQSLARAQWLERRHAELLPEVEYFHVVFTLPEPIAAFAYQNKKTLYDLLFRTSAETLRTIAADPKHSARRSASSRSCTRGGRICCTTILHTWGQNLLHHPHVHCVVPGGGIAPDGERWIACRPGFFLPVRVPSRLFRRLFLDQLRRAFDAGVLRFHRQLEPLRDPRAFAAWLAPPPRPSGLSTRNHPLAAPNTCSIIWVATPIGSPSRIAGC